jgi:hypothetical protein
MSIDFLPAAWPDGHQNVDGADDIGVFLVSTLDTVD